MGGGAVMTSHALAGKHFTQGAAGTQRTRCAASVGSTVGIRLAGEPVAFHSARKAVAFNFTLHVYIVAGFEYFFK